MKILGVLLIAVGLAGQACAQESNAASADKAGSPQATEQKVDSKKTHADSVKLVETSGGRQAMEQNLDKILAEGKQALFHADPNTDPRFADEWVKRMKDRIKIDDYVDAVAKVYESYLTDNEIVELTSVIVARKESKEVAISPELKEKLTQNSVKIQSDVVAETSRLGARLGGEVGEEIAKEHPDWVKSAKPSDGTAKQ